MERNTVTQGSQASAKRNLKQQAYEILKRKLIFCEYPPKSILNESQLAADLNLSRTPIREALALLEQDGYIQVLPKKGIYVTDVTLNDVLQIFEARIELEPISLKLAAPKLPVPTLLDFKNKLEACDDHTDPIEGFALDTGMHLFFIDYCGNPFIIDALHKVMDRNNRAVIASNQLKHHIHDAKMEHIDILQTVLDRKYDEAVQKMRAHIQNCRSATIEFLSHAPTGASDLDNASGRSYTSYMQDISSLRDKDVISFPINSL